VKRRDALKRLALAGAAIAAGPLVGAAGAGRRTSETIRRAAGPDGIPVPPEIDATGAREVSGQLHEFLNRVPDGSLVLFPQDGRYRCENTIILHKSAGLTIEGHGSVLFAATDGRRVSPRSDQGRHKWPRARAHLTLDDCTDVTIRKLGIEGANAYAGQRNNKDTGTPGGYVEELEGQHAFDVEGGSGIVLEECFASDVYGDLLYFGQRGTDAKVLGGVFERSGRQGIAVTSWRGLLVEGITLRQVMRTTVDIEPGADAAVVDGVTFRKCHFADGQHIWWSSGGGGTVGNVLCEDCTISGMGMSARVAAAPRAANQRRGPHAFLRNSNDGVTGGPQAFFRFVRTDGVTVIGNRGRHQERGVPGVSTCGCTAVNVRDNAFTGVTMEHENAAACSA
jgi:hypothetical protein